MLDLYLSNRVTVLDPFEIVALVEFSNDLEVNRFRLGRELPGGRKGVFLFELLRCVQLQGLFIEGTT